MKAYELTHEFCREGDEIISSRKSLGFFCSYRSAKDAIQYYSTISGFRDNLDAFSIRERFVCGDVLENVVYEASIYAHSEDYETEIAIEIGVYGNKDIAEKMLDQYCAENEAFVNAKDLIVEKIADRYIIGEKMWAEGFVYTD